MTEEKARHELSKSVFQIVGEFTDVWDQKWVVYRQLGHGELLVTGDELDWVFGYVFAGPWLTRIHVLSHPTSIKIAKIVTEDMEKHVAA